MSPDAAARAVEAARVAPYPSDMATLETDILIAGGGIAGLAAAARFSAAGQRAIVVDPAPETSGGGDDLRTTAFLQPSVRTLEQAGAWAAMAPDAAPLTTMRLVDAGGRDRVPREQADFVASEMQTGAFGWNVPNKSARAALRDRVATLDTTSLIPGTRVVDVISRSSEGMARLSDGRWVHAKLIVAADGRDSSVRDLAGIGRRRWHYGQKALVFPVTHEVPHESVSTEIHRTGGPLTLVPMPNRDGSSCSAVVWMVPAQRAHVLAELDDAALATELTAETMGLFGALTIVGDRACWPIIGQVADRLVSGRVALVAESAHVVPPIGAQGLNMSLGDIECLAQLVESAGNQDIGASALLARYQARRMPEILGRVAGVHVLNRFAQAEPQPIRDLRLLGLRTISRVAPIRQLAMRLGLGAAG